MKYRKKPVVIEAELFDQDKKHRLSDEFRAVICACTNGGGRAGWSYHIHTLEGPLHVSDCDYIIKGVKGEFYPCKPDIFISTYEKVE